MLSGQTKSSGASIQSRISPKSERSLSEFGRLFGLGALKAVDYVVLFGEQTAETLIGKVKPAVYAKGGDYTLDTLPEAKIVQAYGGRVEFIDMVAGRSTTNVIAKIKAEE